MPRARAVLSIALCEGWFEAVGNALESNREAGRELSTWKALADRIGRDRSDLHRLLGGGSPLTLVDFLLLLSVLDLSPAQLLPKPRVWLGRATERLCGCHVSLQEACAYVRYICAAPKESKPDLNDKALDEAGRGTDWNRDQLTAVVRKVAENVREALTKEFLCSSPTKS